MSARYLGLVSGFYEKKIFLQLSIHADRLFQGMLYLSWKADFPEKLTATVDELQEIGNLPKQSTFYKAKAELTHLKIDGKPLLQAHKDKTHSINYDLLVAPSDEKQEEQPEKREFIPPTKKELPLGISELKKKYGEPFWKVVNMINARCAVGYNPLPRDHGKIEEISEYTEKEINIALGKALGVNIYIKPPGIYSYMLSILREERAKQNNRAGKLEPQASIEDTHDISKLNLTHPSELPSGYKVIDILPEVAK